MRNISIALAIILSFTALDSMAEKKADKRSAWEFDRDMPCYIDELVQELSYPLAWENVEGMDFDTWKQTARAKVFECMLPPIKRADSWEIEVVDEMQYEGYKAQKIRFNINAYARMTAYLLIPDGEGPFPAINALHDHGGHLFIGKEKMIRPFHEDSVVMDDADRWADIIYEGQYFGNFLASNGYVVLSTDAQMWGERGRREGVNRSSYDLIAGNMMMIGRNLSADMTYDDIYCTELLASLPQVDSSRIGCVGCSMGGYRSWMLSALSDRIAAGASVCWMSTTASMFYRTVARSQNGGFANTIPGLRLYLDYPHIASLACPKDMLFINGDSDKLFPLDGVNDAFATLQSVWKSQQAESHLSCEIWPIPHSCGKAAQQRCLEFFDKALK